MGDWNSVLLYGLAAVAANLPFWVGARRFFGYAVFRRDKHFGWVLLEWALAFLLWIAVALWLESRSQTVHPKQWEFWVVNGCLFILLAFPGFTARYLWPRHKP